MEHTLKQFAKGNLYEASDLLLNKLGVKHTQEEPTPIRFQDYYESRIPQYIQNALALTTELYYIGEVCDDALKGNTNNDSGLAEDLEKLRANAHYQSMMLFSVDLREDCNVTRTDMAVLTRAFNRLVFNFPVTVIFRQGQQLSIGTCERTEFKQEWRQGQGEKLGKVSLLRNIDCQKPHRGHLDILQGMECGNCATFDKLYEKWKKVFNSELLTKQFYNDLFEWYQWAVSPEANVIFPCDFEKKETDREDKDTRIIRLITRLMFVWFIKQKDLVPAKIFDKDYLATILKDFNPQSETDGNYYQAILQNLFFGTLNRPIIEDGEKREFAKASNKKDAQNLYRYAELFSISEDMVIELFSSVPFLNCGLFESQDKTRKLDGVGHRYYFDGFSRRDAKVKNVYRYRANIPNILFFHPEKGILSIFDRYVFTIEENTPQDVQVALDPELLGKVFENLLGAYNPETKETARNESGSFYTPREIVQYMVNESLVAHLKQTVGEELESQYRQLLNFTTEEVQLTTEQRAKILQSLFTCKVLDPACGSGAFPMGMLQQMVHILQQVDPDNTHWREVLMNMAVDESRRAFGIVDEEERKKKLLEIEETFANGLNSPDYTRKLYIIESCIYGVDIQPIAILISRLRFFITLICEQNDILRDKPEENFGIKTLPNLESKFVAANSLIDADIHKYNEDWTQDPVLIILKNELMSIRRRRFYSRKYSEKSNLCIKDEAKREQIHQHIRRLVGEPNESRIQMLQGQIEEYYKLLDHYQGEDWVEEPVQTDLFSPAQMTLIDRNKRERERINKSIANCERDIEHERLKKVPQGFEAAVLQVTKWNPYDQNTVSPFLDIEWMFGVTDGFDIVIGNPPYIRLDINNGRLAKLYEPYHYETFDSKGNIYCLFYERGIKLLRQKRTLVYITLNKWLRADYGKKLRKFLTEKTNPSILIDFGGVQVFESANVDTNILLIHKEQYQHRVQTTELKLNDALGFSSLDRFIRENHTFCNCQGSESWVVMDNEKSIIKKKVENKGIPLENWKIQINYGVKTGYDKAFWISDKRREEILSWCSTERERENTKEIIRPLLRGKDIKKYRCQWADIWLINTHNGVKNKLEKIDIAEYPAIKRHLDDYFERLNNRSDKGDTPYNLRNCAYILEFNKPKIIYPETTKYLPFVLDENAFLTNKTCFIVVGEHVAFLTAFLNSSLFKYCFIDEFPPLGEDRRGLGKSYFERIPVLEVDDATDAEFRELVLDIQKEYSDEKAKAIDQRIFDLYGLTQEERETIGYIDFHNTNDNETDDDE